MLTARRARYPPPVRIVHYLKWARLKDGGVVRAVLDLCAGLAHRGHDVTLLTCDDRDAPNQWPRMEGAAGMRRQGLPSVMRLRLDDRLARLRGGSINDAEHDTPTQLLPPDSLAMAEAVLRAAEVAHLHVVWTSSTQQLAKVCTKLAVPYVISPHGMLDDWCMAQGFLKKRVHLALFSRRVLTRALAVHCTAQAELDQSGVHFPKGRGVVAPLPFDASPYSGIAREREVSRGGREPGVLFLGRVNIKKGVETLLHGAALVAQKGVAFRLTVAGPGDPPEYLTKMEGLTRDLNLMGRVNFPRMVVGEEKAAVLRDAELFVLPTSQENFGYVLLEAMAAGLPVVTTRGVDIWRELEASGGAVIVDRTPEGVAEAMERLLRDEGLRREMGRKAADFAAGAASPAEVFPRYEAMYRGA